MTNYGKIKYEVDRGMDVAIGEYAPGRAIVVDKQTYQIGGFYYPGSEKLNKFSPAKAYMNDPNYAKCIMTCRSCGWFGLAEDHQDKCPFCGGDLERDSRLMLRPWGFAPKDGRDIPEAQLKEEYSYVQQPLYSTLPKADEMRPIPQMKHIRMAKRTNQSIIMINRGPSGKGFMVCEDCGAAMPGNDIQVLKNVSRPYQSKFSKRCNHEQSKNVNIGYDFVTDMLVLEFALDEGRIDTSNPWSKENPWLGRAAQSLAEALRLVASEELDIEFTELVTGYRVRKNENGTFVDIYLNDSLSSGAGYAVGLADKIEILLQEAKERLQNCDCDSACDKCLKHYRNQNVHGMLNRFYALQLLDWGCDEKIADDVPLSEQKEYIGTIRNILAVKGCNLEEQDGHIQCTKNNTVKKIIVYPAMWKEPINANTIYISDALLKYAKPLAVDKIFNSF